MSLGTVDGGGVWVSDVAFVASSKGIYWMSFPVVRHSTAIAKHPQVAATIRASLPGDPELAVQISGEAIRITEPRPDVAAAYRRKRGKQGTDERDVLDGRSWYCLAPSFIELIDERNFGFEKQRIDL